MEIIHLLKRSHVVLLNEWYRLQGWPNENTTLFDTQKVVNESSMIFAVLDSKEMIGCARIITNFTSRAYILDVIVSPDRRGQGIGGYILEAIFAHEKLANVPTFELQCSDKLKPYYARFGFYSLENGRSSNIMFYDRVQSDTGMEVVTQESAQRAVDFVNMLDVTAVNTEEQEKIQTVIRDVSVLAAKISAPLETTTNRESEAASQLPSNNRAVHQSVSPLPKKLGQSQFILPQVEKAQSQPSVDNQPTKTVKTVLSQALIERLIAQKRIEVGNQTKLNQAAIDAYREREQDSLQ